MDFRLELFVENLQKSILFYEEILGLTFTRKSEAGAIIKKGNFSLLLTADDILEENHYFRSGGGLKPKGKGAEIILFSDNIEQLYRNVQEKNYPVESPLKRQSWGMTDFRMIDPDGYYLRITSYKQ
ncbi:VOC family protein [Oceanobacillus sp. CFH 90083]|uniref:VOC family protein n=1 Tax=Oceanobacillus sp. CFH 90083 TaxID=2592336 RepID=UPI00128B4C6C|nr:VOC family protein [Oceanobacillus sp. CFH 90083]